MQSSSTFSHHQGKSPFSDKLPDIWEIAELCLQRTSEALLESQVATQLEISHAVAMARETHAQKTPADLLEVLARVQGYGPEHLGQAILEFSEKIAFGISPFPSIVPFAGKLIAPIGFYESFEKIHQTASVLLSPVIYAEDCDAIGTASINPIASTILADAIVHITHRRLGIRPFITIARLDYESWTFLSRKHFEL